MATIEEYEACMTIFYYKRNGDIHSYATGIMDMGVFGSHTEDYALILDYLVIEKDSAVMEAMHRFYVDVDNEKLKLRPEYNLNKYL